MYVAKETPVVSYEEFGINALQKFGELLVASRGQTIPKAIYIAHLLTVRYADVHIASESSHMEDLPDDGRRNVNPTTGTDMSPTDTRPKIRHVAVYEVRLMYQPNQSSANSTEADTA